ncbi:MAG TPA: hypothetical protein P5080_02585 [Candidatus Paceibacterota bacterium]|nr:hypothetical protein [Candidatus Pacearchaeota archaeon]HRZ50856.1 hypothetical protein [Candidatus Paceibacterota bacterium]HSA36577.1 hypothetical protein [Candidatus Paceibacterota bacterium]
MYIVKLLVYRTEELPKKFDVTMEEEDLNRFLSEYREVSEKVGWWLRQARLKCCWFLPDLERCNDTLNWLSHHILVHPLVLEYMAGGSFEPAFDDALSKADA